MIPKLTTVKLLAHKHFRAQTREEAVAQCLYGALLRRKLHREFGHSPRYPRIALDVARMVLAKAKRIRDATNWEQAYLEPLR